MYPQPPILIRRALADDVLPTPLNGDPAGYPIGKGADIFISVWNLHRRAPLILIPTSYGVLRQDVVRVRLLKGMIIACAGSKIR